MRTCNIQCAGLRAGKGAVHVVQLHHQKALVDQRLLTLAGLVRHTHVQTGVGGDVGEASADCVEIWAVLGLLPPAFVHELHQPGWRRHGLPR